MRYKILGKSGLRVSEVALGTMMMSTDTDFSAGPAESRRILEKFADMGGNYFDAANEVYNGGLSEQILGEFVNTDRNRYVVTTKFTNTQISAMNPAVRDHPNAGGNHKKSMVQSVEGSLKRLNVGYIDVLWIHFWEYSTDIEDVMRNINDLVQQGKILHFGLCNTPAWVVARGQTVAAQRGWEPITSLQYQYNLVSRDLDHEILPCARSLGIGVTAYSPLGGGLLTGKYTREDNTERGRFDNEFSVCELCRYLGHDIDAVPNRLKPCGVKPALRWFQKSVGI